MLPLPERSKRSNIRNFKGQENFLLCWYGEGNPCIMWHTLGEPFTLWRATGTSGPVSVALTLTLLAAERRMPTTERAEESSPKWNVLYTPTPVQSHFMQTLKPYQGQHSFYWRYQHTLENQYCLQLQLFFSQGFTDFPKPASQCYGGQQCRMRSGRKAKNLSSTRPVFSFLCILPCNTNSKHYE